MVNPGRPRKHTPSDLRLCTEMDRRGPARPDWKSCVLQGTVGSNPTLSATKCCSESDNRAFGAASSLSRPNELTTISTTIRQTTIRPRKLLRSDLKTGGGRHHQGGGAFDSSDHRPFPPAGCLGADPAVAGGQGAAARASTPSEVRSGSRGAHVFSRIAAVGRDLPPVIGRRPIRTLRFFTATVGPAAGLRPPD